MRRKSSLHRLGGLHELAEIRTAGRQVSLWRLMSAAISVLVFAACAGKSASSTKEPQDLGTNASATSQPTPSSAGSNNSAPVYSAAPEVASQRPQAAQPGSADVQANVVSLLAAPVSHLTAGKRRGAALELRPDGPPTLHVFALEPDTNAGHPSLPLAIPTPSTIGSENQVVNLYMGRDDWPRLITTGDAAAAQHYFRFRPHPGWESPRDEQGGLVKAGMASGFYGVLGHDDPEVLCAPSAFCYEKRQSGWAKRNLPGAGIWTVQLLSNGDAWAWTNTTSPALCRLSQTWDCSTPHPGGSVVSVAHVNGSMFALTHTSLLTYDGQWSVLTALDAGRALQTFGNAVLIVDRTGLWLWHDQLYSVVATNFDLSGGNDLVALPGAQGVYALGGEHGVLRVALAQLPAK